MATITKTRLANRARMSEIHRRNHAATLTLAKSQRHDGAAHARLLALAKTSRFYFEQLRAINE